MIPILYSAAETAFTSNGLGRLSDAISCEVKEKRNGTYELSMVYPTNGAHFADLVDGNYIATTHDEVGDIQPFRIYKISEEIDGKVTINASHISYLLNSTVIKPFSAGSCSEAINQLNTQANYVGGSCPFSFWSDKAVTVPFNQEVPRDVRSLLGGASGSFLDIFGTGEYEFDKYEVKFYQHRGTDTDVQIRYGVNLTDYNHTADSSGTYNAVVPFWGDEETGEVVTLSEWYLTPTGQTAASLRFFALDLTEDFDEKPTEAQLRTLAQQRLDNSEAWKPKENWKVSFVQLWQTPEYENVAALQRLKLCDTCLVIYGGQTIREKVVEVTWDVLRERYSSMELGEPKTSFAKMIIQEATSQVAKQVITKSYLEEAIDHATELITGGLGGYLIINTDASGKPYELLIMDTDDTATAVNVWRFNSGGLGHSHNGYQGPFSDVALTMDGKINAAMITTGILTANIIRAGIIADTAGKNSWNLTTGQLITNLGQIGGWTISDSGIYKEITVSGTTYRVYLEPPTSLTTRFLRVLEKNTDGYWYPVVGISIANGLETIDESTHYISAKVASDGIRVNDPTTGAAQMIANGNGVSIYDGVSGNNRIRTYLGKAGLWLYDKDYILAYISNQGLTVQSPEPAETRTMFSVSSGGLVLSKAGKVCFSVNTLALHYYNENGDSIFSIIYNDYIQLVQTTLNIVPSGAAGAQALGSATSTWSQVFSKGIELYNSTGYVDWHFGNSALDYTARIIEESSGVLKAYNQIVSASDERLKKDIEDITEDDLVLLDKLKPRTFLFRSGKDKSAGLVAQEVLEAEEELGIEDSLLVRGTGEEIPDPKDPEKTITDYYAVDYNGLTALLLAQVQELKKEVAELRQEIKTMKGGTR